MTPVLEPEHCIACKQQTLSLALSELSGRTLYCTNENCRNHLVVVVGGLPPTPEGESNG